MDRLFHLPLYSHFTSPAEAAGPRYSWIYGIIGSSIDPKIPLHLKPPPRIQKHGTACLLSWQLRFQAGSDTLFSPPLAPSLPPRRLIAATLVWDSRHQYPELLHILFNVAGNGKIYSISFQQASSLEIWSKSLHIRLYISLIYIWFN